MICIVYLFGSIYLKYNYISLNSIRRSKEPQDEIKSHRAISFILEYDVIKVRVSRNQVTFKTPYVFPKRRVDIVGTVVLSGNARET